MSGPEHDQVDCDAEAVADAQAEADLKADRIITREAMKAWLLSWGMANELPAQGRRLGVLDFAGGQPATDYCSDKRICD